MTDPRIRCQILLLLAALLVALLAPLAAAADVIDYVNSVRRHGCSGHAGGLVPLRESTRLDEVARQLAQGAELRAAPPLAPDAILERAAAQYARDMATYGYMDHTGRDGSSPEERITRSGYRWRETGENLASGIMRPEDAVAGWLRSPEHCANLMDPAFRHMGVAYAVNPRLEAGVYWAQEFGAPR